MSPGQEAVTDMPNFNPLQRHLRSLQPLRAGSGRTIGMPIEGIADYEQLKWLMEVGQEAGHWIITRQPIGRFGYELTEEGAAFLAQEPNS